MITADHMMKLQNGSDVRGVAVEGVPGEPVTLVPEAVNRISAAFTAFLAEKLNKKPDELRIAVGHDSRISAGTMKQAVLEGVCACGAAAFDCGLASTPAMFMSIIFDETGMDGAVMITASHLPYNRNGLKFFTKDGGLEKADITDVLTRATKISEQNGDVSGVTALPIIDIYSNYLCEKIRQGVGRGSKPLAGMHIVVDAGNGGGGFFASKVLEVLGADTTGSQFLEPDGMFPNHIPNPENKDAMKAISQAVVANHADLGLIFDTDVDRMSAVLPDGKEINRNALIAMMAAILAPDYPGSTIVTDSVTSDELTAFLQDELHLVHHRYMRGYKNVINECIRLNRSGVVSPLAIETSGHGALSENYYLDDGAYLAVKLLIAAAAANKNGRKIGDLIAALKEPAESREYRIAIKDTDDVKTYGNKVLQLFEERAVAAGVVVAKPSYEGVRLVFPEGWALLRMSLHDPNMPLNVESKETEGCSLIVEQVKTFLMGFDCLDTGIFDK